MQFLSCTSSTARAWGPRVAASTGGLVAQVSHVNVGGEHTHEGLT